MVVKATRGLLTALSSLVGRATRWRIGYSDAPPRRPIRANEDLGLPLPVLPPPPERALPKDLDLPLSAFDPGALPAQPREPVRPVASLAKRPVLIDPGERFETFALTPPPPTMSPEQVIVARLERLERNAMRRLASG